MKTFKTFGIRNILPLAIILFGLATWTEPAFALSPETETMYGVDLRDMAQYPTTSQSEARMILNEFSHHAASYFPPGIRFLAAGAGTSPQSRVNSVYGIEITRKDQNTTTINATYSVGNNQLFVRTFQLEISEAGIKNIQLLAEQSISDLSLEISVALVERKMIVRSIPAGILKVYPLGVGAIDENMTQRDQVRILTPTFQSALIEKRFVQSARTFPSYYRGRPFLALSVGQGGKTIYGFHYSITENLIRGFVSHGCMRMRDKDLYELYALVMSQKEDAVPVKISFHSGENFESPYPLNNKSYMRVKNFGTANQPQGDLDREGLSILESRVGAPRFDRLYNFLSSTYDSMP
jgi:hypothetical protein